MIDSNSDILLKLLRVALTGETVSFCAPKDWMEVLNKAEEQKVLPVVFDAFSIRQAQKPNMPEELRPDLDTLMEWLGQTSYAETVYESHKEAIVKLAERYASTGIRMMLLKGYGCSLDYPVANHRPTGDIDVYLFGDGEKGDNLIKTLGIEVKQNEDKHSTFSWEGASSELNTGTTVENHACFIGEGVHPCLKEVERFLEEEAERAVPHEISEGGEIYLPSVMANAVFLPLHTASHFFHGEASLRQLCDWATFVMKHHKDIRWDEVEALAKRAGYYPFLCCLNGIVGDYLGVPAECLPQWSRNKALESRVLEEIVKPHEDGKLSIWGKTVRFFKGYWKYKLVYNESILLAAVRQAQAYLLIKGITKGKSVWEKRG